MFDLRHQLDRQINIAADRVECVMAGLYWPGRVVKITGNRKQTTFRLSVSGWGMFRPDPRRLTEQLGLALGANVSVRFLNTGEITVTARPQPGGEARL